MVAVGGKSSRNKNQAQNRQISSVVQTSSSLVPNYAIEQELHDRLVTNKANFGKLNFSLRWWDPNDLDIHVVCPCGTEIYFCNKKCQECQGELDIDMNAFISSLEPVEHVFFNAPKPGLYKFFVKYYSGPKEY